ncbi:MAG TPA: hypothetical protein VKN99_28155 [Polyangia bacterium]|nr:hypothetical protein [Polyangia bacterium]
MFPAKRMHPLRGGAGAGRASAMLAWLLTGCGDAHPTMTIGPPNSAIPNTDEVQYLDFVIGGEGGACSDSSPTVVDCHVAALVERIGERGDGRTRQLGFMIVLSAWNQPESSFGPLIAEAFRIALARNVAVHLTIETHYFWQRRTDLWNFFDARSPGYDPANVANVERSDWDQSPNLMRYLDWGTPQNLGAPHMCYLAARVQSEVARLGALIGAAVKAGVDRLAAAGHPELFSGITVGSEPSLDNYTHVDAWDPPLGQLMAHDGAPKVRLGYCAFAELGYSRTQPPPDLADAAARVNQRFIESWAHALAGAGIAHGRLYTHIAASADGSDGLEFTNAPIWVAFVDSARPGWTSYPWSKLRDDFGPLTSALDAHGKPHWGGTESAPFDGQKAIPVYDYLRRHYGAGATVVVMNTGATGSLGDTLTQAVYGSDAITDYQRFLRGQ